MTKNTLVTTAAVALVCVGLTGCSKRTDSSGNPPPPNGQKLTTPGTTPVAQAVLTAWQQGDKSAAVSRFVETDWSARPLFTAGSTLSLSEDQFKSLSEAEGRAKSSEIAAQVDELKQLAIAVAQAGRDAADKKDLAQAVKAFTSLKQFGEALDRPDFSSILQSLGRRLKRMADDELAKIKQ